MSPAGWAAPLYARALDAADVGPATSLLDLGCGTGDLAATALGRGARVVVGVDVSADAVRFATRAVPGASFRVGDAHDLGPVDALGGPFAVVAAIQLLTHVANPLKVLREAARAAVPGGTLVVSVWGREEESDVRAFGEALAPWVPLSRGTPSGGTPSGGTPSGGTGRRARSGPPTLTDPDHLRKVAWLAGLAVLGVDEVVCPVDHPDEAALIDPLLASGIGRAAVARGGEAAVREAVLARMAEYRVGDGYRLRNLFRVLVARRP